MCQVRCRCRRMLSSPASDLAEELGRSRCPKPAPRSWPAQLKLSRARQAEFVICDCAIERTLSWIARFRRLIIRYERRDDIHLAFLNLACAVLCFRTLQKSC